MKMGNFVKFTRLYFLLLVVLPGFMSTAYATSNEELAAFKKATQSKYNVMERGFEIGDLDTIVSIYTSDGLVSTGEGFDVFLDRDSLIQSFSPFLSYTVKVNPIYSNVKGDLGYQWCNFYMYEKGTNNQPEKYKFLFLWEKINGEWYVKGDMYVRGEFEKPSK